MEHYMISKSLNDPFLSFNSFIILMQTGMEYN